MVDCQVAWVKLDTIPKQIEEQAKKFIEGKIDKNSLDARLQLILPVLEQKELKYSQIIILKPS
jgi:hypothetical protein